MPTKKITDLTQLTDLDATDSFVVNDSGAGADKRVEFSDLQSEVLNGAAIGTSTAITELQVDNLNLNGNTFSSTDTNGNILIQPNGTGATVINESGAASDFRVEGDTDQNLLFVDASTDRVGIGTATPATKVEISTLNTTGNDNVPTLRLTDQDTSSAAGQKSGQIEFYTSDISVGPAGVHSFINGQTENTNGVGALVFGTGQSGSATERMRIDSSGNVGIATTSPAVKLDVVGQVRASTGILFGSDTAAANALDDYEEGTFTPIVAGRSTAGTGTYSLQIGRYTKIGHRVFCDFHVVWTAHTGTGDMEFGNLPFTSKNVLNYRANASFGIVNNISLTSTEYLIGTLIENETAVYAIETPTGGGSISDLALDTSGQVAFSISYEVN